MGKVVDSLRSIRIYNDYALVANGHPMLYLTTPSSRDVTPRAWALAVKGRPFANQGWYQNGALWFSYGSIADRAEAFNEAMAKLSKLFPGLNMTRSPFRRFSYVPEDDLRAALAKVPENAPR